MNTMPERVLTHAEFIEAMGYSADPVQMAYRTAALYKHDLALRAALSAAEARVREVEAERDVYNGTWCASNIAEGRGPCGTCVKCLCPDGNLSQIIQDRDMEIATLRAERQGEEAVVTDGTPDGQYIELRFVQSTRITDGDKVRVTKVEKAE